MSNRSLTNETRTIHPRALAALGEKACIVMLGVAADLRSGMIPPERYNQTWYCGTSCCIAGHVALRLGMDGVEWAAMVLGSESNIAGLFGYDRGLFGGGHPSDPQLAARAIERYIYEGADNPWGDNS